MALYIRDSEIDGLVAEAQRLTRSASKAEAVKTALRKQIDEARSDEAKTLSRGEPVSTRSLSELIEQLQARVRALGPADPHFDMKKFSDELYEDM